MTWNPSSDIWRGGNIGPSTIGLMALVRYSTRKLLLNRRWILVALVAALVAVVMAYVATEGQATLDEGSSLLNLLVLSFMLPILSLIYGASMVRNEIEDRSITQVVTSPLDRRVSYVGYYLALSAVLAVMLALVALAGWMCFFLPNEAGAPAMELLLEYCLILGVGSFVYSSLFLALGTVFKQPIYLGLLYAFVWEGFVGSLPGAIGQYTIMYYLKVLAAELVQYGNLVEFSGDATMAVAVLSALTVILLALGAWAFREKELR